MKAQFFSSEVVLVFLIFIMLFYVAVNLWNMKVSELNTNILLFDLELNSANIGELLATSSGQPINWTATTVEQFGLADEYNIINSVKLDNFFSLCETNYSFVQELLGIPEYDFYLVIEYMNGTVMRSFSNYTSYGTGVVWRENVIINNENFVLKVGVLG